MSAAAPPRPQGPGAAPPLPPSRVAPPPADSVALPGTRARDGAGELVFAPALARGMAFLALAAWGSLHWMSMLEPAEPMRGWTFVGVGALAMLAMLAAGQLGGRRRVLAATAAVIPLTALALLAGGVADELLKPARWGELASGISRGISDLPGVRVPYRGSDPWLRTVIPLGGSALVLIAALLAFWPRRSALGHPLPALIALVTLYVVPVVALAFPDEFVRGAVFSLLMVAFLLLERLRIPDARSAVLLALAVTAMALVLAPTLNRQRPWWDYETWALQTSASKSTTFTWDHSYGALSWPRDGRELIRVKARTAAYWKAENLDQFDGARWLHSGAVYRGAELPYDQRTIIRWTQTIRVSIRNLRSEQFIAAGSALSVNLPHVTAISTLDGSFNATRTLHRGDTYTARVYTPRPTEEARQKAGIRYPPDIGNYLTIGLPEDLGNPVNVTFPAFGDEFGELSAAQPLSVGLSQETGAEAEQMIESTALAPIWQLSKTLRAQADTPEDYVASVLSYLRDPSFSYSESPPTSAETLPGFLFDAKQGYCQQFSGAMALLLRMAGIPARVATGFTPGAVDAKTKENVVRDFDAHSWVEAYYPGLGWLTFDPTPADSPARSQPTDAQNLPTGGGLQGPSLGDVPAGRPDGTFPTADPAPWWQSTPLLAAAALALLALAAVLIRRRRRGAPPALSELERALRRTRREPAPGTTLHALEQRFAATPAAVGYVRALRDARFGPRPAATAGPTRAQRRGLRSELARGSGLVGRLRAWWALPPR